MEESSNQPPSTNDTLPPEVEDKATTYSIVTLIVTFFLPVIGLVLAIIGLRKAKKSGSKVNKVFALISLAYALIIIITLTIAVVLAFNSPSFQNRQNQEEDTDSFVSQVEKKQDVDQQEFDAIQTGMTVEAVKDALDSNYVSCKGDGVDTGRLVDPIVSGTYVCTWGPGIAIDKYITVTFTNGLAVSKDKFGF